MKKVRDTLLNIDKDYFTLCGDLNLTLNPLLHTENYNNVNNLKAMYTVLKLMKNFQLPDYRILNSSKKYLMGENGNHLKQARLDYILISESLSDMVETISIKLCHSVVLLELKFNKFVRGLGLWKFNNSLLTDMIYILKKRLNKLFFKPKIDIYRMMI